MLALFDEQLVVSLFIAKDRPDQIATESQLVLQAEVDHEFVVLPRGVVQNLQRNRQRISFVVCFSYQWEERHEGPEMLKKG